MQLPLAQFQIKLTFLQQLEETPHNFISVQGESTLLMAPPDCPPEECHDALDALIYSRQISRYVELTTPSGQPCFLVLRPGDPGRTPPGDPQGGCETSLAAP